MAEPLIQVVSVIVSPESLPCEVYSMISVYDQDDLDETYPVYEREPENAEVISEMGQVLLLTDLHVVYTMSKPAIVQ